MNNPRKLTAENYTYRLNEQYRNRIIAQAERDHLLAQLPAQPRPNYLVVVSPHLQGFTTWVRSHVGQVGKQTWHIVHDFLLWVWHLVHSHTRGGKGRVA